MGGEVWLSPSYRSIEVTIDISGLYISLRWCWMFSVSLMCQSCLLWVVTHSIKSHLLFLVYQYTWKVEYVKKKSTLLETPWRFEDIVAFACKEWCSCLFKLSLLLNSFARYRFTVWKNLSPKLTEVSPVWRCPHCDEHPCVSTFCAY